MCMNYSQHCRDGDAQDVGLCPPPPPLAWLLFIFLLLQQRVVVSVGWFGFGVVDSTLEGQIYEATRATVSLSLEINVSMRWFALYVDNLSRIESVIMSFFYCFVPYGNTAVRS